MSWNAGKSSIAGTRDGMGPAYLTISGHTNPVLCNRRDHRHPSSGTEAKRKKTDMKMAQ